MPDRRMRARLRGLVLVSVCAVAACSNTPPSQSAEGEARVPGGTAPLRLAVVTTAGGERDRSNAAVLAGLEAAHAKLGAEVQIVRSTSVTDYQSNLTLLAAQDFDETFAIGSGMRSELGFVAINNPKRRFALIDATLDRANVTSVEFREQEGAFLAGALAALVSKTKRVGFLGGVDRPEFQADEAGFVAGVHAIAPTMRVTVKYVGSFERSALAQRLAGTMYDAGADVLYVAAGQSTLGAFTQLRARSRAYAIAAGAQEDALAPGKLLGSVNKRLDVAAFTVAQEAQSLKLPSGTLELGLGDGGVELSGFKSTDKLVAPARARLAALRAAIVSGRLVPPRTRADVAAFEPPRR